MNVLCLTPLGAMNETQGTVNGVLCGCTPWNYPPWCPSGRKIFSTGDPRV